MNKKELAKAVDDLSSPSRRKRQEAAHAIAESMLEKPQNILSFTDDIFDALERPEAQTRWELLNSLTLIVEGNTRVLAPAVHFAEPSLFDEDSSTVRLASFRFITAVGSQTKALSKKVWPMLEESIQVYHGDPQYREMLMAIADFVAAPIDPDIKKAVVDRITFDAKNSTMPIIKHLANDVLKAARGRKIQQKSAVNKKSATTGKQGGTKASASVKKGATTNKAVESKGASGNKKAASKKVVAKKASSKKATTKKITAQKGATKKAPTKKPTAKGAAAKKSVAKKPSVKGAVAKKPSAKGAAVKKAAAKRSVSKTPAAKKVAVTKKSAAKKPATTKKAATPKKSTPKKSPVPKRTQATNKTSTSKTSSKAKTLAAKKPAAKKAKSKIAGSKAAKALKKLASKKSR